jgi:hypothetical protein
LTRDRVAKVLSPLRQDCFSVSEELVAIPVNHFLQLGQELL